MSSDAAKEVERQLQEEWSTDLILQALKVIMAAVDYFADGTNSRSMHMALVRESRLLSEMTAPEPQEPAYLVAYHMSQMLTRIGAGLGIDMQSYVSDVATAIRSGIADGHTLNLWPPAKKAD